MKIKKEVAAEAQGKLEQSNVDYKELEKKYWRLVDEKENVEKNAKEDFKRLQDMISKKQREMQEIQNKYLNYVDYDLEQKKIENRLELKYGKEIEDKQRAVDGLNKALNDLIRDHEICKAKLNSIQKDSETNLNIVKDSNKKQVDLLLKEIQDYQEQKLFNDYKDKYNEVKVKRDELERKNELLEKELEDCRNECQQIKNKHNDLLIQSSKDLEKVRSEASGHRIEKDRLVYKNQSLEQENVELRGRFNDFERRVSDQSNEAVSLNKIISLKDKELADLQRQVQELNERSNADTRSVKNCYEEELHHLKLKQSDQINRLQEETRNEKARVQKLEEKLKAELQAAALKEKEISELERKNEDLKEKISSRAKEVKEEKSTSDRYLLENEELKRRLIREEARNKQLSQDVQVFEQEVHNIKKTTVVETVVNHTEGNKKDGLKTEVTGAEEEKIRKLKDKLKASNDKLVRAVSEKVILLHALNQLGVDVQQLLKSGGESINIDPLISNQNGNKHVAITPPSQQPHVVARRLLSSQVPAVNTQQRDYIAVQNYEQAEPTQRLVSKYLAPGVPVEEITGQKHSVPINPTQAFDSRHHQYTLAYPEMLDPYVRHNLTEGHPRVLQGRFLP